MTYPEALRAYADWMEHNTDLHIGIGRIQLFSNDEAAIELVKRGEAVVDAPDSNQIVYVNMDQFKPLAVQFVVAKKNLMQPAIKDGEVVWVLKLEFTADHATQEVTLGSF